jgi:signal transduction histidine kinase
LILAPLSDLVAGRTPIGGGAAAFETMHRNASRLLRLINQLLDLAKIDAGQMRIALTTVDIAAMLRSALTGFEAAATKKGVALSVHGADELAPIALDPAWIESAIANLVANALRLTPAGGSVRVSVEDRGGEVAISVADDGPGIAQKDLTRIFERFAQGDTATRVIGGTGIGLALVREAVRLHGGDVGVVSELGKGAVFTLTIPRRAAQPLERPQQGAASNSSRVPLLDELGEHAEALERSGPGPTAPLALVVEDNPELRVFIANVLAVRYRVRAVADGAQALASLAHVGPDVVVSDVAMPGMDGYALCRRLRADPRTSAVPVLLVTARTEEGSVLEGFEAGANDYVLKPFHGRELLARVDAHVRLRRMAQELVLRERHAMLGVLAASVAHQVRNPLTTLVSGLPAMKARLDGKVTPSTFDLIDLMMDCATRIERLTSDLVDLSRVDREEGGDFRPSDGLQSSIRMVKARLPHNVVIEDRVASSPIIRGRAGDVNHVFMNILDNAVRAVAGGGKVTVDAAIDGQAYVVRIADDGPGIEPSVAERIFEPFFTTRPAGEGTGLGLSIAQQVVQQCGGSIRVGRSRLGGAEFVIELPLVARADSQPALLAVAREALH